MEIEMVMQGCLDDESDCDVETSICAGQHPVTESYRGWQPSLLNSLHRFGRAMGETSSCNYAQAQRGTLGVLEFVQYQ